MPDWGKNIRIQYQYATRIAILLGYHLGTHILPSEPVDYGYYPCIGCSTCNAYWRECELGNFPVKDIPIKKVRERLESSACRILPILRRVARIIWIRQNYTDNKTTDSNHQKELEDPASTILTVTRHTRERFPNPNPDNRKISKILRFVVTTL